LEVTELQIPDVKLVIPRRHNDPRGLFCEIYNSKEFESAGIPERFVQDNLSISSQIGTVRGLHIQSPPHAQAKLVRVSRGRILDVAVDLRRSSPTYGRYAATELSRDNWAQLYIPTGFAHGFCTLEPDTEVVYKVSRPYAPEAERGVLWCDPELAIQWPVNPEDAVLSDKDSRLPLLKDIAVAF
jgi:dTDP-4-dehydrorhamnose 3,5-epimerase